MEYCVFNLADSFQFLIGIINRCKPENKTIEPAMFQFLIGIINRQAYAQGDI